jgi:mutual gliding-motility protein MglA
MALINIAERMIHCKLVYYGPGTAGKTTNLQYIHWHMPPTTKGDLLSIATETERTLFFDCLPPNQAPVRGLHIRFHLYTVPGCVLYERTRLAVLKGVDGVVFVADSQRVKLQENLRCLHELTCGLRQHEKDLGTFPIILQYNKRDVPDALTVPRLDHHLNRSGWERFEAIADEGTGVMETFAAICAATVDALQRPKEQAAHNASSDQNLPSEPVTTTTPEASIWSQWLQTVKRHMKQ